MTTPETLRDRVSKLSEPDRDTDWLIYEALVNQRARDFGLCALRLTSSVDDVEKLRKRVLPGSFITVSHGHGDRTFVAAYIGEFYRNGDNEVCHYATASTEPLARLLALLDALIRKESTR